MLIWFALWVVAFSGMDIWGIRRRERLRTSSGACYNRGGQRRMSATLPAGTVACLYFYVVATLS